MALPDRILPLCDLLLGAAYADQQFVARERAEVRKVLAELSSAAPARELEDRIEDRIEDQIEDRIAKFDPAAFRLADTAAAFVDDPEEDRRRLLQLVAKIHDADDEFDFAEDEYLRALATALGLPARALSGLVIEVIEVLREDFARVRRGPPPVPPRR